MSRIAVLGGTGYAGSNIVSAAASRGHQVRAYSCNAPEQPIDGVSYIQGSAFDPELLDAVVADADVVVHALAPRGELEGKLEQVAADLIDRSDRAGVRLAVIGGAGSLLVSPDGPKLYETPDFPAEVRPEAETMDAVLGALRSTPETLDWFYVSPAAGFGSWAAGEATGQYRTGDEVLVTDAEGNSFISGADFGQAVIDEVEHPTHRRQRFTVAY